jgi:hypothetical protein
MFEDSLMDMHPAGIASQSIADWQTTNLTRVSFKHCHTTGTEFAASRPSMGCSLSDALADEPPVAPAA